MLKAVAPTAVTAQLSKRTAMTVLLAQPTPKLVEAEAMLVMAMLTAELQTAVLAAAELTAVALSAELLTAVLTADKLTAVLTAVLLELAELQLKALKAELEDDAHHWRC